MTQIKGYNVLTDAQKAQMNEFKELEERVLRKIDDMIRNKLETASGKIDESMFYFNQGVINITQAFMWLNRAITLPGRVTLPEDLDDAQARSGTGDNKSDQAT